MLVHLVPSRFEAGPERTLFFRVEHLRDLKFLLSGTLRLIDKEVEVRYSTGRAVM